MAVAEIRQYQRRELELHADAGAAPSAGRLSEPQHGRARYGWLGRRMSQARRAGLSCATSRRLTARIQVKGADVVYMDAVRMSGGTGHQHITEVRWKNPDANNSGQNTKAEMVVWIKKKGGAAYVCGGGHLARVVVVEGNPPYLRTYADTTWSDNLLALPKF